MSLTRFLKFEPDVRASTTGLGVTGSARLATTAITLGFLCAWLIPYHTYPYWSFYHDYISLVGVLLALFVLLNEGGERTFLVPRPVLLPVLLAASIGLDAACGRMAAPGDAVIAIGYLIAAGAAMTVGAALVRTARDDAERTRPYLMLTLVLAVAGVISALITFAQYLSIDDRLGDLTAAIARDGVGAIRPSANLGQPNQLALMLCWSLCSLWYLFQRGRLKPWLTAVAAFALLISLALTQSKIAWLIIPGFAVTLVALSRGSGFRRVPGWVIAGLMLFFVAVVLALPTFSQVIGTTTQGVGQRLGTNSIRLVMILQALYISLQHPLLGAGWNGFGPNQVLGAAGAFPTTEYAQHAHNFVANLAAEKGWLVTLAVVASIGYWCWTRLVRRPLSLEIVFAAMLLGALGVHSMVEFPLWYAYVLMPTALVVGLLEAGPSAGARPGFQVSRLGLVAAALLSTAVLVAMANDYRHLVQSFRAFSFERIGWTYNDGTTAEPEWTTFPHFYAYIRFAGVRPQTEMTSAQIADGEAVMRRFAYEPVLMRMATIYALNHRESDALNTMDTLRHLYTVRYAQAYGEWAVMASEFPAVLGKVYARLPPP